MSLTDFLLAAELADDDDTDPLRCADCDAPLTALEDDLGALLCAGCLTDDGE